MNSTGGYVVCRSTDLASLIKNENKKNHPLVASMLFVDLSIEKKIEIERIYFLKRKEAPEVPRRDRSPSKNNTIQRGNLT